MTDSNAIELLCAMLDERGVEYETYSYVIPGSMEYVDVTRIRNVSGRITARFMSCNEPEKVDVACKLTPEQAVVATLGDDDDYEAKMDALLCYLTNGKFSKSRQYSLDFMKSCVDEEYEAAYAEELAVATLRDDD